MKLEGGIEYQDVIIGRGPVAANGKVVCNFRTLLFNSDLVFACKNGIL